MDTYGPGKCILLERNDTTSNYHPAVSLCNERNLFVCELGM